MTGTAAAGPPDAGAGRNQARGAADFAGVPDRGLPLALADLHWSMAAGDTVEATGIDGALAGARRLEDARIETRDGPEPLPPQRFHAAEQSNPRTLLDDVIPGAGFTVLGTLDAETPISAEEGGRAGRGLVLRRDHTLPDTVRAGMRLLVCGLNPSPYAADAGVGFGRPGNRFWPAAAAAGLVTADRDPRRALVVDQVGMTDLVKRVTARAAEVGRAEYQAGLERVERLCEWLRPEAVCMVGLAGWRAAADPKAGPGWQGRRLGPAPVYVMPSTSGLNARVGLEDLTQHLQAALKGQPA